jgi:transcriptional regulator with XRE-family HTH domain
MSKKETIGSRLQAARIRRQMTLCALSRASSVGIGTISEIEGHPSRVPTVRTLRKLAKALDIPLTDLVGSE